MLFRSDPRQVVPASVMPAYPFLKETPLKGARIGEDMKTLRLEGVPYTDEDITNAEADLKAQVSPDGSADALVARYPKAVVRDFDGNPQKLSEMDALIAYLQMLGTLVDFSTYDDKANLR